MHGRLLITTAATLAVAAPLAAGGASAQPAAHASRTCSVPRYPGFGYFTSLTVRHTSCATGRKLALAYYHCRTRHGVRGHCTRRVLHFTCRERRNSIPTEFDARVTCRRGAARVIHTYQQKT